MPTPAQPPEDQKSASPPLPEGNAGGLTSRWLTLAPATVGLLAAALCFAAAGVALWRFYENGHRLLKENLRDGLRAGASVAALSVDPELHRSFKDRSQENTPEYAQATARLEKLRQALQTSAPYRFVYTCVREPDGIHFILDPTPPGDADNDGVEDKSHIGDLYPEANPRLKRVFDSGQPDVDEDPVVDSWGSALSGYAPIRDSAGNIIAVAGLDLELTEYNAEIARLRGVGFTGAAGAALLACLAGLVVKNYHHRLRSSVGVLVSAMHQARAGERAKAEFLATVSHELRTPLNGIVGMVGLLKQSPLNARQREQAETVHRSAELLQLIIDDILDWSKIESGALGISRCAVNLETCLREVRDWFTPLAAGKDLTFEVTGESDCPACFEGDPIRLRQVLMHLAGNAVKFTHEGGVLVSVRHEDSSDGKSAPGRLIFTVRDTGIGIEPGLQEKIFEPFSQADSTTTRHYGGTGLGLAIGRRLCVAMGGQITLRSRPGHGSEFTFDIPCLPLPCRALAPVSSSPQDPAAALNPAQTPEALRPPNRQTSRLSAIPLTTPIKAGTSQPGAGSERAPSGETAPCPPPRNGDRMSPESFQRQGSGDLPTLLISPDRMLIQLATAVFKRLQRPFEHSPDLASARALLSANVFQAVLLDPGQVLDFQDSSPNLLRQSSPVPLTLIALVPALTPHTPAGFDATLSRRLPMKELETALHPRGRDESRKRHSGGISPCSGESPGSLSSP